MAENSPNLQCPACGRTVRAGAAQEELIKDGAVVADDSHLVNAKELVEKLVTDATTRKVKR
jgi:hypothetical protein